jgi:hypothetical protein
LTGLCEAYIYTYNDRDNVWGNNDYRGYPIIYSDNYNKPDLRLTKDEKRTELIVNASNPIGWRNSVFKINGEINAGTYIWFGVLTNMVWYTCFDFCDDNFYVGRYSSFSGTPPNNYPMNSNNRYKDIKLSMYFTNYPPQNYLRMITQGVSFTDKYNHKTNYKRTLKQSIRIISNDINSILNITRDYLYKIIDTLTGQDRHDNKLIFIRFFSDKVITVLKIQHWKLLLRKLMDIAGSITQTARKFEFYRYQKDDVKTTEMLKRNLFIIILVKTKVFARDLIFGRFLIAKTELVIKSCVCREIVIESGIR